MSPFERVGKTDIPKFQHVGFWQIWTTFNGFDHLGGLAPCPEDSSGVWIFVDLCSRLLRGVDLAQTGQALRGGHYYDMQSMWPVMGDEGTCPVSTVSVSNLSPCQRRGAAN